MLSRFDEYPFAASTPLVTSPMEVRMPSLITGRCCHFPHFPHDEDTESYNRFGSATSCPTQLLRKVYVSAGLALGAVCLHL